ncbi:MAG: hypothetical protein ABIS03_11915 [Gemmatimonadaceae bacterium]
MRTRLTRIAMTLAVIAAPSLTAVSCKSDSTAPASNPTGDNPSLARDRRDTTYAWMGQYHNQALAYGFEKIKQSKDGSTLDRCKAGLAALKDFQKAFRKPGGTRLINDLTIVDGACEEAARRSSIRPSNALQADELRLRTDISVEGQQYLTQILNAIDQANSANELSMSVARIRNSAAASLGGFEAGAVAGAGSIAVSSAGYWEQNEEAWGIYTETPYSRGVDKLPSFNLGIAPPSGVAYSFGPRGKTLLKIDAAAAVAVLLVDWWMGEFVFEKAAIRGAAASFAAAFWPQ